MGPQIVKHFLEQCAAFDLDQIGWLLCRILQRLAHNPAFSVDKEESIMTIATRPDFKIHSGFDLELHERVVGQSDPLHALKVIINLFVEKLLHDQVVASALVEDITGICERKADPFEKVLSLFTDS